MTDRDDQRPSPMDDPNSRIRRAMQWSEEDGMPQFLPANQVTPEEILANIDTYPEWYREALRENAYAAIEERRREETPQ